MGRLEVRTSAGVWGTVCDDGFGPQVPPPRHTRHHEQPAPPHCIVAPVPPRQPNRSVQLAAVAGIGRIQDALQPPLHSLCKGPFLKGSLLTLPPLLPPFHGAGCWRGLPLARPRRRRARRVHASDGGPSDNPDPDGQPAGKHRSLSMPNLHPLPCVPTLTVAPMSFPVPHHRAMLREPPRVSSVLMVPAAFLFLPFPSLFRSATGPRPRSPSAPFRAALASTTAPTWKT